MVSHQTGPDRDPQPSGSILLHRPLKKTRAFKRKQIRIETKQNPNRNLQKTSIEKSFQKKNIYVSHVYYFSSETVIF